MLCPWKERKTHKRDTETLRIQQQINPHFFTFVGRSCSRKIYPLSSVLCSCVSMKSTHTHTFVHHYFFLCCLLLSPALEHNSSRAGLTFCHHITSSHTDFTVRHILTPPPCVCVSLLLFYFYKLYARGKFSASSAAAFENSFRNNRRFMENCVVFCLLTFLYMCAM